MPSTGHAEAAVEGDNSDAGEMDHTWSVTALLSDKKH